MIKHQIILSSSYSEGTRICLDLPERSREDVRSIIDRIDRAYDGKRVYFSIHMVHTDSTDWDSVVKKDPYFSDVRVIGDVDEFVELIRRDRYLKGIDVAKYILSKEACTHTRIQKLTYMCYADYMCETGDRLFEDRIFAFQYGPVVESVYEEFRDRSKVQPGQKMDVKKYTIDLEIQMKSRILFAEDGEKKLCSIEKTLKRYMSVSTDKLVEITHKEGTPWSVATEGISPSADDHHIEIRDEYISGHHCFEQCRFHQNR